MRTCAGTGDLSPSLILTSRRVQEPSGLSIYIIACNGINFLYQLSLAELILSLLGRFMIAGSLPGHDRISTLTGQTFDSRLSPYVWGFTLSSGFILRGWSGVANHPMVESEDSTFLVPSSSSESVDTCRGYLTCKPTGLGGPAGVWGSEVLLSRRQLP
ncbi:hypothetical protein TREMEDRAFT_58791 [Tremella mesenterica DSM 1558]|uniref:uncharacterized protein n=1 Tax=Tremella mesenterica (strain ATCC 24925 / CBS 8224 / DSM 1558 / NBRC 9311 / NRRL Y-6157 / RJB 2259-6 / UBC 559-6) TaxID=578456 RepID=UPI0003F4A0ED|nr:uncharacterized protein TREMEDRAFT_58791 [Tremella mesenterica DSM 1558]EIW72621.1 hypothetical protein TREMEDRAFT_58791 [Tremella mesenterica DSM 1558]